MANNLGSKKNAEYLISEFSRIIKKNGILIIDTNLQKNNYRILKKHKEGIIETNVNYSSNKKLKMFFPSNKSYFANVLKKYNFEILDVGYMNFKIFDQQESEIIYTARKI